MTTKSNSCSLSNQCTSCPSGFLKFCNQTKEPWSVLRVNYLPSRYGLKWCVNSTTASSSLRVTQYLCSCLLSERLAYAITRTDPSSDGCDSTAPIPTSLASVSSKKKLNSQGMQGPKRKQDICEAHQRHSDTTHSSGTLFFFPLGVAKVSL